jgi:hypothetical protein
MKKSTRRSFPAVILLGLRFATALLGAAETTDFAVQGLRCEYLSKHPGVSTSLGAAGDQEEIRQSRGILCPRWGICSVRPVLGHGCARVCGFSDRFDRFDTGGADEPVGSRRGDGQRSLGVPGSSSLLGAGGEQEENGRPLEDESRHGSPRNALQGEDRSTAGEYRDRVPDATPELKAAGPGHVRRGDVLLPLPVEPFRYYQYGERSRLRSPWGRSDA